MEMNTCYIESAAFTASVFLGRARENQQYVTYDIKGSTAAASRTVSCDCLIHRYILGEQVKQPTPCDLRVRP